MKKQILWGLAGLVAIASLLMAADKATKFWVVLISNRTASDVPLTIKTAASQTGKVLAVQDSAAAQVLAISRAGRIVNGSKPADFTTVTTLTTVGDVTLTAAQILGGLILRDPNGGARTDTLPTAALLVAAMPDAIVGSTFEFTIRNTADAAETITVAAGTGGTASGTMTIAQNNTKRFLVRLDNVTAASEAYTVYSLGTVVH